MIEKRKSYFTLFISVILLVSLLSGCTGNNAQNASSAKPPEETKAENSENKPSETVAKRDTIVVVVGNEPTKLTTYDHNAAASDYINQMNYNGLFKMRDINGATPDLVDTYEPLSDTEWLMTLKPDVKFHDGTILSAQDVKASLELARQYPDAKVVTQSVEEVEIIDDLTFKLILNQPRAAILDDLSHHANYIMPAHLIESGHNFGENPIGTGPYTFVKWVYGDYLELTAFDDYFDTENKPAIKNVIWKIIPEATSRAIALEAGEADLVLDLGSTDIPRLQSMDGIEVALDDGSGYFMLLLNNTVKPFDNVLVRRGLNAAIDKTAIVEVAMDGLAEPGVSMTPPIFPETTFENTDTYSVEKALAYFEEAGIDPKTIILDIIVTSDETKRAAEVIQSNLSELGITVTISFFDNATALQKEFEGDYVGAIGSYTTYSNLQFISMQMHSDLIGASNRTRINETDIDEMIETASITIDPEERAAILTQIIVRINELTPHIPLYQNNIRRAYNSDLEGFNTTPFGNFRIENFKWK